MQSIKLTLLFLLSTLLLLEFGTQDQNNISDKGFTINLIPIYSIHSPFHQGKLAAIERSQKLTSISKLHAPAQESSFAGSFNTTYVRPKLTVMGFNYLVPLRIGKLKLKLAFDTGSSITWTQCSSCNPCFPQKGKKYDPTKSHAYKPLSPNHPFCEHNGRTNDDCPYHIKYFRGRTEGNFGRDKFTFEGQTVELAIIFGCSLRTYGDPFPGDDETDGVLGMGRKPQSFAMQLSQQTHQPNKFSYCLTKHDSSNHSTIRFGSDIILSGRTQETPLVRTEEKYYVNLIDISIQGKRLKLRKDWFKRKPDGYGGCNIDSGAAMTDLYKPAYDAVKKKLIAYFNRYNITQVQESVPPFDLCFHSRRSFNQYPYMNLHFEGASFHMPYSNLFHFYQGKICLTILPSEKLTIIGAWQQAQHQIVFDVRNEKVVFSNDIMC